MSKIFLIGDSHIGLGYPNSVDKWHKVHKEYFSEFLIPLLKNKVGPNDIIIHLGDLFDNRNVIPINLLNYAMDIVEEISKLAPFHIIIGNHDLWSRSASEINTIRPFRYIPNVFIYDSTKILEYNGLKILMMPYIENRLEQIKLIEDNKNCDYLLCHSDLNGCKMHLSSVAHKNSDKIDITNFIPFKRVMSGHIHLVQKNKNFTFIGSNFQMDRNDTGDQKGIFIINTDDDTEEFIPNTISPIFKKVRIVDESGIEEIESLKNTKDYIDILISNNLLINNRKLRRKLESILETGKFASVDYIDDIININVSENIDTDVEEINLDTTISLQLEYEEFIKKYILNMKYENNDFKEGVLLELSTIVNIYNESYKIKKPI